MGLEVRQCKKIPLVKSHIISILDVALTHRKGLNIDLYVLKYAQRIICLWSKEFSKESEKLSENSNLFNFDKSAIQELCIKYITLFNNWATKYRNHKAEDTVQIQAETLCSDDETVGIDLEQDSTCCFNNDTSNID